jgi:hypothetical protein
VWVGQTTKKIWKWPLNAVWAKIGIILPGRKRKLWSKKIAKITYSHQLWNSSRPTKIGMIRPWRKALRRFTISSGLWRTPLPSCQMPSLTNSRAWEKMCREIISSLWPLDKVIWNRDAAKFSQKLYSHGLHLSRGLKVSALWLKTTWEKKWRGRETCAPHWWQTLVLDLLRLKKTLLS